MIFAQVIFVLTKKCPFPARLILTGNSRYVVMGCLIGICFVFLPIGYGLCFSNRVISNSQLRTLKIKCLDCVKYRMIYVFKGCFAIDYCKQESKEID